MYSVSESSEGDSQKTINNKYLKKPSFEDINNEKLNNKNKFENYSNQCIQNDKDKFYLSIQHSGRSYLEILIN
jgi:hypothetical protein